MHAPATDAAPQHGLGCAAQPSKAWRETRREKRSWNVAGQPAGSSPNLEDSLREIGQDADAVVARARGEDAGAALRAATEEALALGVFGSPTFSVDGELFWGDDRLDDALTWRGAGTLAPRS